MIRGGHVDVTVLGALQVSEHGDIANSAIHGMPARRRGAMISSSAPDPSRDDDLHDAERRT